MDNTTLQEKRRAERKVVFLQCELEPKNLDLSLPVWIKNFSPYGMKLVFFKMFYCNKCPRLKDILHLECDMKEKCEVYNLEKLIEIISEGKIFAEVDNEYIEQEYKIKWYRAFSDLHTIEFGIEFLN